MKSFWPFLLIGMLTGCRSMPPAPRAPAAIPADPTFEHLMNQAAGAAARGRYATVGTLYAQAFDRAKILDRRPELVRSSLCLAAAAINAEEVPTALAALRTCRDVSNPAAPTALRLADLTLRLAWLQNQADAEPLRALQALVAATTNGLDAADARLTLAEAALRSAAAAAFPPAAELQTLPPSLQIRARALQAWQAKNPAAWLAAARDYAALGNTAAAFRETLRCAEILHDPEAAHAALRIAEGLHDLRRQRQAKKIISAHLSGAVVTNDVFLRDTAGNPIYAQGGGAFRFNNRFYWYGTKYAEAERHLLHPEENVSKWSPTFLAFTCYSSDDLVHWKFEGFPMTRETLAAPTNAWVGRMGVVHHARTGQYVLVSQFSRSGTNGILFAVAKHPAGPFSLHHVLTDMPFFHNGATGDQTLFQDDDGQAYLVCSSARGRDHLYIAPLRNEDFLGIDTNRVRLVYQSRGQSFVRPDGSLGQKKDNGIEGNCLFKYKGNYYLCGSDLYGWRASHIYVLQAANIFGPYEIQPVGPARNLPYLMRGAAESLAHQTQTGFFITLHGSEQDLVVYCGDRWGDFAPLAPGYNQWLPLSFDGLTPIFNDLPRWRLDAARGTWSE